MVGVSGKKLNKNKNMNLPENTELLDIISECQAGNMTCRKAMYRIEALMKKQTLEDAVALQHLEAAAIKMKVATPNKHWKDAYRHIAKGCGMLATSIKKATI